MYFKLYIPSTAWGIILITLLILTANAGLTAYENWSRRKKIPHNNEVAGIIFGILSLIYTLLVSFVIVAVWENYEDLNKTIEKETDELTGVLIHSSILPDSLEISVSNVIKEYCTKVVNEEWDMLESKERTDRSTRSAIPALRLLLFRFQASRKPNENYVLSLMDNALSSVTNLRRERLSHTRAFVPQLVWMVLIIGTIMIIVFSWFFYIESNYLKRIFLSFLWAMMGMCLFLVYMLDHPFIGSTQVSRDPFKQIIRDLNG